MLENLIAYFDRIPSLHRVLILTGGLSFFWLLESGLPLMRLSYAKWKHAGTNLFFTLTTVVVNLLFATGIVLGSDWSQSQSWVVLNWMNWNPWVELILGLLLLDLISAYFIHWIEHKIKFMWKFHLIHHADTYVDTTTANRHHPGESVFRAVFTLLAVLLTGAPMWMVMLYQSASALCSQFNHANISLPKGLDRAISWLIVSPNMHKIHHHYVRPQTDSNYGNIFSIWDHLFGTYRDMDPKELRYGVDVLPDEKQGQIRYQLQVPFDPSVKTDH